MIIYTINSKNYRASKEVADDMTSLVQLFNHSNNQNPLHVVWTHTDVDNGI